MLPCKPLQPVSLTKNALMSSNLHGHNPALKQPPSPVRNPAASQPRVGKLWLGLGHFPCITEAMGIKIAILAAQTWNCWMVSGQWQPCMPNSAPCVRHSGTFVKLRPAYISACRHVKVQETLNTANHDP